MFCQQCGAIVPEDSTFCEDCSKKLFDENPPAPGDVFANRPPGGYQAPPPVSDYLQQQSHTYRKTGAPVPAPVSRRSAGRKDFFIVATAASAVGGIVALVSTFLPWIGAAFLDSVGANPSGWTLMLNASKAGGNFLFLNAPGIFLFTGLWSLLAGLVILAGTVMLVMGYSQGGHVAGAGGIIGVAAGAVNLIMLYKLDAGVGTGVWILLLFSIMAVIGGEFAHRYSTGEPLIG